MTTGDQFYTDEVILTTKTEAHDSGKRAADRMYILSILDLMTKDITKIREIMLHDDEIL